MSIELMTEVWKHSKASGNELLLLLAIADFANDRREAWPSVRTLSQRIRADERTVKRMIKRLMELDELRVEYEAGPRRCNLYYVQRLPRGDKLSPCQSVMGDKSDNSLGDRAVSPDPEPSIYDIYWSDLILDFGHRMLIGSRLLSIEGDIATIEVADKHSLDWLNSRASILVRKKLSIATNINLQAVKFVSRN